MKRIILLFTIICFTNIYGQAVRIVESKVISATIFRNRALVAREASLNLAQGKYAIVLSALPSDFLDESVRVSGTGSTKVRILDIKIKKRSTLRKSRTRKSKSCSRKMTKMTPCEVYLSLHVELISSPANILRNQILCPPYD